MIPFFLVLCFALFSNPDVVITGSGIERPSPDMLGTVDAKRNNIADDIWRGMIYEDYAFIMHGVAPSFTSAQLYRIASLFFAMAVSPPTQKKQQNKEMLSVRMMKLLWFGKLQSVAEMWQSSVALGCSSQNMQRVYVMYLLYLNRYAEALEIVTNFCQNNANASEVIMKRWKRLKAIISILMQSNEEAETLMQMHKSLLEGRKDDLSEVRRIILERRYTHVTMWDIPLIKMILKFVPVDKEFVKELPVQFYPLLYHDRIWGTLSDECKLIVVEQLTRSGAVSANTLFSFYAQVDTSSTVSCDVHTKDIAKFSEQLLHTNITPLQRAFVYKMMKDSPTRDNGKYLDVFTCMMAKEGLLMVVCEEMRSFLAHFRPEESNKAIAPVIFLLHTLCKRTGHKEILQAWYPMALSQPHLLPVIPIYIILKQHEESRSSLASAFVRWYQNQQYTPELEKILWVLAQVAPWLTQKVSLPQIPATTEKPSVVLDGLLAWAAASEKKAAILGTILANRETKSVVNAIQPAFYLDSIWGCKLAVEYILR